MEFLTLLIVLGFIQWWGSGGPVQQDDWYERWSLRVADKIGSPTAKLVVTVGVPCLLVVVLQDLFDSLLFGLLSLMLYVFVLLYSLGRGDFSAALQEYLVSWENGDSEAALIKATAIGDFYQSDAINDHVSLHDHVRMAAVYQGFERWFVVVFWFLILGPAACIAYRLCYLSGRQEQNPAQDKQLALKIIHYLDWLPARLLLVSFTLTGNFVNCFNRLWQLGLDNPPIPELLDGGAQAAISGFHERSTRPTDKEKFIEYARAELLALQSLLSRSVVCWLMIIAVLQMI
jgi:AmpE protein